MNWAWTTSLEQLWRSPTFPMWLALGAAASFGLIVLITLLRAQKSVANGALAVIALLAIGAAAAASIRGFGAGERSSGSAETALAQPAVSLPALACVDDIAGDTVLAACEKVLFGSADSVAAAVSYTGAMIDRLTAAGDVATANKKISASVTALRRAVERDRYGLVAYVLQARDRCQPGSCAAYAALSDHNQIAANMEERTYDGLVSRYAPGWNAPQPLTGLASLPASVPTGKPTNAEFPTSASIPPINIMTPEPPLSAPRPPPAAANAQAAAPRPAAPAAKKPPAPKPARPPVQSAPVQLAPAAAEPDN
ncbi:hypothetical protein [Rhodopseudomonas sp. RCAM05734]|uniref:hypothetical protein n=1 Tax=Rhodopseudomonas sp. RCAM05734 TaxID=3457549 RepID=UPI0040440EED